MKLKSNLHIFLSGLFALFGVTGCISDGVTTSASAQPEFSADTVNLGKVWAGETTPTAMVRIYNRNSEGIILSRVGVASVTDGEVRLNLDGTPGKSFENVEIRANDSIYLLAEALPTDGFEAKIEVSANGKTHYIPVTADPITPEELNDLTISSPLTLVGDKAYRIGGNLTVSAGATLTIEAGASLYFRDGAGITVEGTLLASGTPEKPVTMRGDRLGMVVPSVSFDVMAGQWKGVSFTPAEGAEPSSLEGVAIVNTQAGLILGEGAELTLTNCRISNSQDCAVSATGANLKAVGCEISNAAASLVSLSGGKAELDRCTLANYYLFTFPSGAAVTLADNAAVSVVESIIFGNGPELSASKPLPADVKFVKCLFGAKGSDDANFINCIWESDPQFKLDLEKYEMDFRLGADSPALGKASGSRTDIYGKIGSALGAYN